MTVTITNMKLHIEPDNIEVLRSIRASIADSYEKLQATEAKLAKMRADLPAYRARLDEHEDGADHDNAEHIARLVGLRASYELIERRLPALEHQIQEHPYLLFALHEKAKAAVKAAVKPDFDKLIGQVVKALKPFHNVTPQDLTAIAFNAPMVQSFCSYHFYFNEHTGPLTGRKVAVHVNYDLPDFIFMEHPQTRKLLKVERVLTKRRTATPEEIAKSNAARRAHINGALGEIGNLESPVTSWIERSDAYTTEDKARGRFIAETTEQHKADAARTNRQAEHIRKIAGTLGSRTPSNPRNLRLQADANELEREALADIEKLNAEGKQ